MISGKNYKFMLDIVWNLLNDNDKVFGGDVVDIIESQFWPTRVDHVGLETTF